MTKYNIMNQIWNYIFIKTSFVVKIIKIEILTFVEKLVGRKKKITNKNKYTDNYRKTTKYFNCFRHHRRSHFPKGSIVTFE